MSVAVTTAANARDVEISRARRVASDAEVPYVQRRGSLARLLAEHAILYVVGRLQDVVTDGRHRLHVDAGLLHAKVASGDTHPLIRALGPVEHVVDGTLGLAGDALHIAAVTGARVTAVEASPLVFRLCERGLDGLQGWDEARGRVSIRAAESHEVLAGCHADAVFIAPMFKAPASAKPGYELFRALADHRGLDAMTMEAAKGCAPRVVVRVEKGHPSPPGVAERGWRSLSGGAVDYWIWER